MPSPVVSITLPSLYPIALERALRCIEYATRCPYEVVVVCAHDCRRDLRGQGRIVWIKEETPAGCSAAHTLAFTAASGTFVTAFADDHLYVDGWDVLALDDFADREEAFHRRCPDKPFALGLRHVWPTHVGTEFGIYYPYFPLMRRLEAVELGGWLKPDYKAGFSDSDLGMRVWAAGGRCEWSREGLICVHPDDNRKTGVAYTPADMALFLERWAPRYGAQGWDLGKLRGFNMDITPERHKAVVDRTGRSCYYNDVHFTALVGTGG